MLLWVLLIPLLSVLLFWLLLVPRSPIPLLDPNLLRLWLLQLLLLVPLLGPSLLTCRLRCLLLLVACWLLLLRPAALRSSSGWRVHTVTCSLLPCLPIQPCLLML
jgi:hypothetical protein